MSQRDLEGPMPEQVKKRLEEEIKQLEYELTTELPAEIKKAVALGDLSENAEYHMAKQRQVFVNARLGQLKKRMGELAMVNLVNIPKDKVGFGATVTVFDSSKNEEITYKLVTSEESDVSQGLISTTSPIGRCLLGKKVGDVATVDTERQPRVGDSEAGHDPRRRGVDSAGPCFERQGCNKVFGGKFFDLDKCIRQRQRLAAAEDR
jgi:Transcription elongation factor